MSENLLLFPPLVAAVELLVAVSLEVRVALALGRIPKSRVLAGIVRDVPRPRTKAKANAAALAVLLALFQLLPLGQERLLGGAQPPGHISGAGVIIAEVLFGIWLWLGTRPGEAGKR
jgi:hypothetical protein